MGAYEDILEDIMRTFGEVPSFMMLFTTEKLIREWSSWKSLEEIDLERARYLLSTDELIEKMLSETENNVMFTLTKPSSDAEAWQEETG
jgi:amino acid permease